MPDQPADKTRILLGDDDPAQRDVLHEFLEEEGYAVDEAATAGEVLSRALQVTPDALVLDLHGLATPELFASIRARHPDAALVLLSADTELPHVARAWGADSYLSKPYDGEELLDAIAEGLSNAHAHRRGK